MFRHERGNIGEAAELRYRSEQESLALVVILELRCRRSLYQDAPKVLAWVSVLYTQFQQPTHTST